MNRSEFLTPKVLSGLKKCAILFGLIIFTLFGICLLSTVRLKMQTAASNGAAKANSAATMALRKELQEVKVEVQKAETRQSTLDLQESIERMASANSCSVTEFQAMTDIQPYLGRFSKAEKLEGWQQTEIMLSIRGSIVDLMAVLTSIVEEGAPVEFNTIELGREEVKDSGAAIVNAKISLRLLTRQAGEA